MIQDYNKVKDIKQHLMLVMIHDLRVAILPWIHLNLVAKEVKNKFLNLLSKKLWSNMAQTQLLEEQLIDALTSCKINKQFLSM